MKKFMIRCDIEGVSGVVSYEQAEPGKPEYAFGQKMFMADLQALLNGLNAGGAEEIVIYDEHYYGRNIDIETLPQNTTAICGKPPYRPDWAGGLDATLTGVILLGFHSKFGTPDAMLHHTYELDIKNLLLNGVSVGEIGMEAAIAGDYNVPVLMVTGDSAGIFEAENLLPGVIGVKVKDSINEHGGICYPLSVTTEKIKSVAINIAQTPPQVAPYKVGNDVTLEVELNEGSYLTSISDLFAEEMSKDNTLIIKGVSATDVWSKYWKKKVSAQHNIQKRVK